MLEQTIYIVRTYLVKRRENVVGKLYLSNRCCTSHGYANAKSHNSLLTEGSVEDSVFTWERREQRLHGEGATFNQVKNKQSLNVTVIVM